jgi:TonB family protein
MRCRAATPAQNSTDDKEALMMCSAIPQGRLLTQVVLLCASAIIVPTAARTQESPVLSGTVADASGAPVLGAIVDVKGSALRARTDERGQFHINGAGYGTFEVTVRRLGFASVALTAQVIPNRQPVPLDIVLQALPTTVAPVVVHASKVEYSGRLAGYYERLHRRSNGSFITREQIDRGSNKTLSQLLAGTPGINSTRLRSGGGAVRMRGMRCRPLVWLDGVPLPAGEVDLDAFPVSTLQGVELYLGATNAPMAYTALQGGSSCGTILLWSRGRDTERADAIRQLSMDLEELTAAHEVYTADLVDKPAHLARQDLEVSYPLDLVASKTAGSVVAEFVVSASGEIEPGSLQIVSASQPLFAQAALQALSRAHFAPALKDGVAVRQLVQQPFSFSLGPDSISRSTAVDRQAP